MSGPASVTKRDFREAIKFWPFPPQNDLKWKASQFFSAASETLPLPKFRFLGIYSKCWRRDKKSALYNASAKGDESRLSW